MYTEISSRKALWMKNRYFSSLLKLFPTLSTYYQSTLDHFDIASTAIGAIDQPQNSAQD